MTKVAVQLFTTSKTLLFDLISIMIHKFAIIYVILVKNIFSKYKHICRFPVVLWESKYINRYFSIIFSVLKVDYFKTKFTMELPHFHDLLNSF